MWNDPFKLSNLMIPVWEKSRPRLHSTARLGTIEDAKKYLDEGDDINLMTKHEPYAPLHDAVYEHRLAMVKLLVERKANIHLKTIGGSDTALGLAANSSLPKSTEATMYLLDQRADVNDTNAYGMTALMYAVNCCNHRNVQLLLERKADPRMIDKDGMTAISFTLHSYTFQTKPEWQPIQDTIEKTIKLDLSCQDF